MTNSFESNCASKFQAGTILKIGRYPTIWSHVKPKKHGINLEFGSLDRNHVATVQSNLVNKANLLRQYHKQPISWFQKRICDMHSLSLDICWLLQSSIFHGDIPAMSQYTFDLAPAEDMSMQFNILPHKRWNIMKHIEHPTLIWVWVNTYRYHF